LPVPPNWSQQLRQFAGKLKQNPREETYVGDGPFANFVVTEQSASWHDFLAWSNELHGSWCFRGQRESVWSLHTLLDRAVERRCSSDFADGSHLTGYYHLDRGTEQRELLFRFQQQAHLYIQNLPSSGDLASWFALMQHHGAPTPLLDWTKSPYVAAYFAFEEEPEGKEKRCAVWTINLDWLESRGRELLQSKASCSLSDDPEVRVGWINNLLAQSKEAVIVRIDPLMSNERMAAQQGVLLCKLLHEASFGQNLMRMMICPETPDQPVIRKLELRAGSRKEFLKNLRAMNIHRGSLFPGLDGFARSLRLDLEIKTGDEAGAPFQSGERID